jgi:hypothetical protein
MEDFSSTDMVEAKHILVDRNRGDDTMLRFTWFGENGEILENLQDRKNQRFIFDKSYNRVKIKGIHI